MMKTGSCKGTRALAVFFSAALVFCAVLTLGLTSKVRAENAPAEIAPLVKYEFLTADNHGKDSMGRYDLKTANFYQEGGTGPATGVGTIEGGAITFNGQDGLAMPSNNDLSDSLKAFTLSFELKLPAAADETRDWGIILGFNDFNATNYFHINIGSATSGNALLCTNALADGDKYWGKGLGNFTDAYHQITVTVQPGGKLAVYRDGVVIGDATGDVPADWSLKNNDQRFGMGAAISGNASYPAKGSLKNVRIYDFAMTAAQAGVYKTAGKLTQADITGDSTSGFKYIKSVSAPAFADGPTSGILLSGMSEADMLDKMNPATADLTLSDNSTVSAAVTWKKVEKTGTDFKAVGELPLTLGYALNVSRTVEYALTISSVKSISAPKFTGEIASGELKNSMTAQEMLAKVNPATVTVTYGDDTTENNVPVVWKKIRAEYGKYFAVGDVMVSGSAVGTVEQALTVVKDTTGDFAPLAPIAKYEFSDELNPGKDSMANFNLRPAIKAGESASMGSGTVTDGQLYLDGTDCLTLDEINDFSEYLSGFTLNFQFKMDTSGTQPDWMAPISFGFNDWNATKFGHFIVAKDSTDLRFNMNGLTYEYANETLKPTPYWGPVVASNIDKSMVNVTLSVMPGGEAFIVANGTKFVFPSYPDGHVPEDNPYVIPEDWNLSHSNMQFAIGGDVAWGNGYSLFKGWVDNVTVYDFALNEQQVTKHWQQGEITVGDMNGLVISSLAAQPTFPEDKVTTAELKDTMTETQMLKRINKAIVTATFLDKTTLALNVSWDKIENKAGVYTLVGSVKKFGVGYACIAEKTEIRVPLTVKATPRDVTIASAIENGSLTADKQSAMQGETVIFTVTPNSGYKIEKVYVNDVEIQPVDGVYSAVMGADGMTVSATFIAEVVAKKGCGCGSEIGMGAGLGGAAILLAVAGLCLLLRRKKSVKSK